MFELFLMNKCKDWTQKENKDFLDALNEYGTKWTKISTVINRSPESLRKHYAILKKVNLEFILSEENESNNEINISDEEQIKIILQKKITNHDKINQLSKFELKTIFNTMIQFSKKFPSICADFSILLSDFFSLNEVNKSIFLDIVKFSESTVLLQFCRSFSVLNDYELMNIEYIANDPFFFRGPVFKKTTRNEILENARNQIENNLNSNATDLKTEIARLTKFKNQLREEISIELNKLHEIKSQNLISLEVLNDYPILKMMINKIMKKQSTEE